MALWLGCHLPVEFSTGHTHVGYGSDLYQNALPFAKKEWEQVERFAEEKLNLNDLQKWDTSYVSEKLKQELFDFDDQILKPYFPLPNVLKGLFEIVKRLYGLHF